MKKIDEILASCIEEIESGKSTVEQCLEQNEQVRGQLEPLLRIAMNIQSPPSIKPTQEFKTKARVHLMEYIHKEQTARKSWKSIFAINQKPSLRTGWLRVAAIIVSAILILTVSGTGTVYATQDSLPGEMLYPVKTFSEDFRVWLEMDKAAEVALELEFAGTRLDEMGELVDKAPENLTLALSGYRKNLDAAIETIGQIADQNQYSTQLEQFTRTMTGHFVKLDMIEDDLAEYDSDVFKQTREITMNHHSLALRSMSQLNGVQATEMNIQLMQNRLQRAYDTTSRGQSVKAEEALSQYIQLNYLTEEILQISQNSGQDISDIVKLNFEAAQRHQHQLGKINGNVSGNLKSEADSITEKMAQNQGGSPPSDNGNPMGDPIGQDNQHNQPDNQQEPDNQPQEPGNPQQEPDSQQQPDTPGPGSDNGQGGSGNGSGGK